MLVTGILTAILYSMTFYVSKFFDGQEFDMFKFLSTLLIGILVGATFMYTGQPLTRETFLTVMAQQMMVIILVEKILKTIYKYITKRQRGGVSHEAYRQRSQYSRPTV
mgnify:CR=1 FL=1